MVAPRPPSVPWLPLCSGHCPLARLHPLPRHCAAGLPSWPTAVPLPALPASPAAARSKASGSSDGLQAGFYQDPGNTVYSTALRVLERVAVRLGKPPLIHTNKGIHGDIIESVIGAVFRSGLASATRARTRSKLATKPACSQQIMRAPRARPAMRRQTGHAGELGARALEPRQLGPQEQAVAKLFA